MSKKHFIVIAAIIRRHLKRSYNALETSRIRLLVNSLCYEFKKVNKRFNKARFLKACGYSV